MAVYCTPPLNAPKRHTIWDIAESDCYRLQRNDEKPYSAEFAITAHYREKQIIVVDTSWLNRKSVPVVLDHWTEIAPLAAACLGLEGGSNGLKLILRLPLGISVSKIA
jgi:hypothetical protein